MADYTSLKQQAQAIRDEVKIGANTANRVGLALEETIKALETENKRAEQEEVSLENAVQLLQDNTEDLPGIREKLDALVINDLTTGGADKALSAEMGKMLGMSVSELQERVHELGDFPTAKDAEDKAREPIYSGSDNISIIHYTINRSTDGLILQHQDVEGGYHRSVQTLLYHGRMYVRFVWFTNSTRTVLLENANFNRDWWETSISHLEYDKTTHTIKCRRIGQDVNSTKWITLPSASTSTDGLMTKEQVKSLEGKQDQLANYVEIPGGKTTIKYPNGTARVEVSNVRAALWANDDKVAIAADANGTRMLYQKTAEDGSIEHRDEISIGKHDENSATHITLTSKSTTEDTGEKITNTSTIQVNPTGICMSSPEGEIEDVVKAIKGKADKGDSVDIINDLTTGGADKALSAEMGKELGAELATKAPKSGYAPDLKVNFAKELVGRGETTEEVIGGIRPTGVRSIGDGNATIERIKGRSVVWNQFAPVISPSTIVPISNKVAQYTYDKDKVTITTTQELSNDYSAAVKIPSLPHIAQHKYLIQFCAEAQNVNVYVKALTKKNVNGKQNIAAIYKAPTDDNAYEAYIAITSGAAIGSTLEISNISWHDLTQMFGAGKEPTTIEQFEARKPLNVTNEYNEGTIVSYDGDAIKSVGFNAYNGEYAKVIGGKKYHATGTTSVSFAKELGADTTAITLDSEGKFIPEEDGYVYAEGKDIVIHLTHSYTPEHVNEYEEDVHLLPNVKSILDANGNQLFPYGLLSAGSVHDEIAATKAIKRVGVVDMGDLNWNLNTNGYFQTPLSSVSNIKYMYTDGQHDNQNAISSKYGQANWPNFASNVEDTIGLGAAALFVIDTSYTTAADFKAAMSGVLLYYELAEPIEVDLPEPLNMTYEAWDFGTEELVAEGATTPLNADIVYQFNAVDRIRENTAKNEELEAKIAALEETIKQLTAQTINEGGTSNEQM